MISVITTEIHEELTIFLLLGLPNTISDCQLNWSSLTQKQTGKAKISWSEIYHGISRTGVLV